MQITKINSFNSNTYCDKNNARKNFGQIPAYKLLTNTQKKVHEDFIVDMINYIPNISTKRISEYLTEKNKAQIDFLHATAKKLYYECYNNKTEVPHNAQEMVEELAFGVKKPDKLHYKILSNNNFSFEDSKNLIQLAEEKKQNYLLIRRLLKPETLSGEQKHLPAKQIQEIVTSPNAEKLEKQYDTYHPFITLTRENKDFTQKLLTELEAEKPSFDPEELNKIIAVQRARSLSTYIQNLPENTINTSYSPEAINLLTKNIPPRSNTKLQGDSLTSTDINFATYILKTTTSKNHSIRSAYMKKAYWMNESPESATIFLNKLDSDENFSLLYAKLLKDEHPITSRTNGPLALMYYADSIGSNVALKNYKKFANILHSNEHSMTSEPEKTALDISKNIKNRFYISNYELNMKKVDEDDIRMEHRTFSKLRANIKRAKRKFNYEFLPQILGTGKATPIKINLSFAEYKSQKLQEAQEILKQI